jgi:DNA-binding NarL/FixJ family response regulator
MPDQPRAIRILIADDHPIVRDGLRRLLEADPAFTVVGVAVDGLDAVERTRDLEPDILLLDVSMPRADGLDALRMLAEPPTSTRVVLLTAGIEPEEAVQALRLGARGVILKDTATELLYKCLLAVAAGEYWVGHEHMDDIVRQVREPDRPPEWAETQASRLTSRELDIIGAVVEGAPNKDIAALFGITEQTVKNHLSHIFDKLGVSNRLELALYAVHHQLLARRATPGAAAGGKGDGETTARGKAPGAPDA